MREFLYATGNRGKVTEAQTILGELGFILRTPEEVLGEKADAVPIPEVEETATDYRGNARLKAVAYAAWSEMPSIADDAGLEVRALGGAPGVYTARYAGEHASSADNRKKLLLSLQGEKERAARFVCVLCVHGLQEDIFVSGFLEGRIALEERGAAGFGYDSIFIPDGSELTLAEMKEAGKPVESHRRRAFHELRSRLCI